MTDCTCTTNVCRACRRAVRADMEAARRAARPAAPNPVDVPFGDYEPCFDGPLRYRGDRRRNYAKAY